MGKTTKAIPLDWAEMREFANKLFKDEKHQLAFFIICGIYTGLRYIDLVKFKKSELISCLNSDRKLIVVERKTGKVKKTVLHSHIKFALNQYGQHLKEDLFMNKRNTGYLTNQYINRLLTEKQKWYGYKWKKISCHSLRKTMGRRVYDKAKENPDISVHDTIFLLMNLFNHTDPRTTLVYIGIEEEKLDNLIISM